VFVIERTGHLTKAILPESTLKTSKKEKETYWI